MEKSYTYLLLGSNQGDRLNFIRKAIGEIDRRIGRITLRSSVYKSDPWGFESPDPFLNVVVKAETNLEPHTVLRHALEAEASLGRERGMEGYHSRTIDIDILFYDELILDQPELIIPHPRLHLRRFTLVPLNEISPGLLHPVFHKTIHELLLECKDPGEVRLFP